MYSPTRDSAESATDKEPFLTIDDVFDDCDWTSYELEPLHQEDHGSGDRQLYHDSGALNEAAFVPETIEGEPSGSAAFPALCQHGTSRCSKLGIDYLKTAPCPSCTYDYGERKSIATCVKHKVLYLKSGACHICTYAKGHKDGWHARAMGITEASLLSCPDQETLGDQQTNDLVIKPSPLSRVSSVSHLLKTTQAIARSVSSRLKNAIDQPKNEPTDGPATLEEPADDPGQCTTDQESHEESADDAESCEDWHAAVYAGEKYPAPRQTRHQPGATLSQISGVKDQLVKLLSDEATAFVAGHAEAANIRLYLTTSALGGDSGRHMVATDLTPFLSSGESFLYYTVDDSGHDYDPPKSPAELMATSIKCYLAYLTKWGAAAFSRGEWSTVLTFYKRASHIAHLALVDPLPQPTYMRDLWKLWDDVTSLASIGIKELDAIQTKSAHSIALPEPLPEIVSPGEYCDKNETDQSFHIENDMTNVPGKLNRNTWLLRSD